MYIRNMLFLATMVCAAATPLAAQQAQDSTTAPAVSVVRDSSTSNITQGPRVTPVFQTVVPRLDRSNALTSPALPQEGGSNTIVISTLSLVLILLIVVLLIR